MLRVVRACVFVTVGIFASWAARAHAEPALEASGFIGVDRFGVHTELGNSWAREQVPGTAPLVGGRVSWLAIPALPAHLQLAAEAELAFAPAFTGNNDRSGRMSYFAPVFEWRAHALLRLTYKPDLEPHLVLGAGGETVASSSPFMAKETDPVVYWGAGVSAPISRAWRLRIDLRHGLMAARDGGTTSTVELEVGLGMAFGLAEPPRRPRAEPPPAPQPAPPVDEPARPPQAAPAADPDGDGIVGDADRCPDQAEDFDGFEDDDGCPEPDNDHDGIDDARDACPAEPETRNGFEDDDGCPDQLPADVTAALATPLTFEPGRARVTEPARTALRALLAILEAHPGLRLAIVGHPDRAGNADLAKRRAEAVKWYLIDQGVIEDRLATRTGDIARAPAIAFELIVATTTTP
jgi:OmpA-OmpF porin, OOP family